MGIEALESLGKVAGIAGIAIGALVLIFRSVIEKNIFPNLTKEHSFRIIRMIIMSAVLVAILGVGAWVYLDPESEDESFVWIEGVVHDFQGNPLARVNMDVANGTDITDNSGNFAIKLQGKGEHVYDLSAKHAFYEFTTKKVRIDFGDNTKIVLPEPIRMNAKELPPVKAQIPENNEEGEPVRSEASNNRTASITLNYMGDLYDCSLELYLNIGGKIINPTSNQFNVSAVPAGSQNFSVSGTIDCGINGSCEASGNGSINIVESDNYYIVWNTATCVVGLYTQGQFNQLSTSF